MERKPKKTKGAKAEADREARLGEALRANLARRKAQARARAARQDERADKEGQG